MTSWVKAQPLGPTQWKDNTDGGRVTLTVTSRPNFHTHARPYLSHQRITKRKDFQNKNEKTKK